MADNVTLPGTGAVVAADDISGVQYQRIKLVDGTADSTAAIPGDATNGLDVDVTRLPVDGDGAIGGVKLITSNGEGYEEVESYNHAIRTLPSFYDVIGETTMNLVGTETNGLYVDVKAMPALPAGTNLIGKVSAGQDTASIYDGTTALTPKFAAIAASSSGNNTVVAAVSNKKIRVLSLTLSANAAVNAKFQSAAGGTDITGLFYFAANGGMVLPHNPQGWFETAASALLNLNLSGAVAVGGCITYIEV